MKEQSVNVLIADDEDIVREGLKHVIDWNGLGFCICGEASDGDEALEKLAAYQPDLTLLDVRMPAMNGTDLIRQARERGFAGEFIFLSGYSDFSYAQTALQYGASFYLTKPINEEELEAAVIAVKDKILRSREKEKSFSQYIRKAKAPILQDLLLGKGISEAIQCTELGLAAPVYQVAVYCGYTPFHVAYDFAELLRVANRDNMAFEELSLDSKNVILLKGAYALDKFRSCLSHYACGAQKGSPLDTIFIAYGRTVSALEDIWLSYQDCRQLMQRRFYCAPNQHVLSPEALSHPPLLGQPLGGESLALYRNLFLDGILSKKRSLLSETLIQLEDFLRQGQEDPGKVRHFLIDIFLQVKQSVISRYPCSAIPLPPNASVIGLIEKKNYLYEIIQYFREQLDMILRAVGGSSNDMVFNDIVDYIDHNHGSSLKLEDLASLFGYNPSYLGKLFTKKMGKSFNAYLDETRIHHAAELLRTTDLKIYEVAARTGYSNVNYFYQKFHSVMSVSPSEYKRSLR